jgi:hypothetical protein
MAETVAVQAIPVAQPPRVEPAAPEEYASEALHIGPLSRRALPPEPSHAFRNVILSMAAVALMIGIGGWIAMRPARTIAKQEIPAEAAAAPTPADIPAPPPPEKTEPEKTEPEKPDPPPVVAKPDPVSTKPPVTEEATFQLTTSPKGADVTFDTDRKCTSPCKLNLTMGRHTFVAKLAGHRDVYQIIEIPRDTGLIVDLPVATGTLSLISNPPGMSVAVDGAEQSQKTPMHVTLTVGSHKIQVSKGAQKQEFTVDIKDGSLLTRTVEILTQ